jgi:hypothetical protein
MQRGEDDALRLLAIERLGPFGEPRARAALEFGIVEVEPAVLAWEGSSGTVSGHRVILVLTPTLADEVNAAPVVVDALTAAIAAAIAEPTGNSLAELVIRGGAMRPRETPYRGRL